MIRVLVAIVMACFVLVDVAPAFAQSQDTIVVAQQQKRRTLFDLLFGDEPKAPPPVEQPRRQQQQPKPTAALPPPKPTIEKAPGATRLAVFGDSLAVDLSKALERFYAEDPNLVVINQGVGSSGFVRNDYFDWDAAVAQQIAANSFDVAVVIVGINDRQEIRENASSYPPLSERWSAIYQARIAAFLDKLRLAGKPTVWVGLPPMSKSEYSAAISQISAIQRLAAFSSGAEFLDIYERFLGEDGKYSSHGPDVSGQNARMRKDDGIHFSSAGSDKLAFYLSQSIRNFYRGGGVSIEVADPLLGTDAGAMVRLPYQGLGQIRLLEVAGAVIPLSRSPNRAGDLLTAASVPAAGPAFTLEQLMTAPIGRVDAFGVGIDPNAVPVENAGGR
ncbi:hypothetical protein VW29_06375 [Devosia limi DSM 17137]|uniref:Uncharacterized protein n=1 Tax=Devosia limi DSM 17137 TaxID=1121477 RepID=A0A0F5LVL8_9HYPH|nr:DUF459 domain-containing protein [Devosia limi]KKB85687.1 hypothetical protein VW29_06375 [Devosia limi DSM 17137]SHE43064.1 hypothetical protein SAMN02745223_00358 [Devosia limi DSM 17137]